MASYHPKTLKLSTQSKNLPESQHSIAWEKMGIVRTLDFKFPLVHDNKEPDRKSLSVLQMPKLLSKLIQDFKFLCLLGQVMDF